MAIEQTCLGTMALPWEDRQSGEGKTCMITGAHMALYSKDATADRAFFRDILGFAHVNAGDGWLIFAMPAAESVSTSQGIERPACRVDGRRGEALVAGNRWKRRALRGRRDGSRGGFSRLGALHKILNRRGRGERPRRTRRRLGNGKIFDCTFHKKIP